MGTRWMRSTAVLLTVGMSACSLFGGNKYDQSTPPEGSVERRVNKSPDEISRATAAALQELGMTITQDQHDALGGRTLAQRGNPDKDEVIVWYKSLDRTNTALAVKVGKGDQETAELIQYRIAQHLGTALAKTIPRVGAVAQGEYDPPVAQATAAMERALTELGIKITHREIHDTWAWISSSQTDAIPVDVRLERTQRDKTRVHISAGTNRNQDNQQLADRVKTEFEEVILQTPAK